MNWMRAFTNLMESGMARNIEGVALGCFGGLLQCVMICCSRHFVENLTREGITCGIVDLLHISEKMLDLGYNYVYRESFATSNFTSSVVINAQNQTRLRRPSYIGLVCGYGLCLVFQVCDINYALPCLIMMVF